MLPLPLPSLMVLVGPAGAGKSTIARTVPASWRVELDALREMVSDDPGDQLATADAAALHDQLLRARLRRRRPTLVDSTNTDPAHRDELIALAHAHGVLAIAIRVMVPLHRCIARQARRPLSQQVPGRILAQQHAATPGLPELRAEGFDLAVDASEIDFLGLLLERATEEAPEVDLDALAAFGPDLAAAVVPLGQDEQGRTTGTVAIGSQALAVRHEDDGAQGYHWQIRVPCTDCGCPTWAAAHTAADLLAVHRGLPHDLVRDCDICR
ncbi:ATP-binding protein [Streptomyces albidoflavus]|uniref:AAA family ATPase n=1 Tax=Streptomyces albidoflavus TaxID=1886 RepID=UPI00101E5BC7|nr:AAA family ATPase [Streptomyces albidoflavus]RZD62893.1 ATP-binding protein [Streptomyces albidoflavus]